MPQLKALAQGDLLIPRSPDAQVGTTHAQHLDSAAFGAPGVEEPLEQGCCHIGGVPQSKTGWFLCRAPGRGQPRGNTPRKQSALWVLAIPNSPQPQRGQELLALCSLTMLPGIVISLFSWLSRTHCPSRQPKWFFIIQAFPEVYIGERHGSLLLLPGVRSGGPPGCSPAGTGQGGPTALTSGALCRANDGLGSSRPSY